MRRSTIVLPAVLLLFLVTAAPARASSSQAGDFGFSTNIGFADARSDNAYRSDSTVNFTLEYQKTGYAAYRASAGFLTVEGREVVTPARGTRDADALFVTGNFVLTPRFAIVHPFLTAGLGLYSVRLTDNLDSVHDLEVGLNWGFGMNVQLLKYFELRGEVGFHYISGDVSSPLQTLTLGGRFTF
jgi:outer membrane protein with beta-barrel domain